MFKKVASKVVCAIAYGAGYVFGTVKRIVNRINSFIED